MATIYFHRFTRFFLFEFLCLLSLLLLVPCVNTASTSMDTKPTPYQVAYSNNEANENRGELEPERYPLRDISGTVKDEQGNPLIGANISVKGTTEGTLTDIDGNFSLSISSEDAILVVSYLGYITQEIALKDGDNLTITMREDSKALSEVVVTGIRASQQRAVALKRNSAEFLDAITSESAGKLPDANIAEALQRVAGVSISRTRGQGDFISIRGLGPEFARGSLNGRSIVSASTSRNTVLSGGLNQGTGRATNFDVLPSDIIETIEVYKTSSAELVEGGIGGTVNIKTVRPISFGNKFGFNIKGVSFFERDLSPFASAYGSWVNQENNFGAFVTVSYSDRKIREDAVRSFSYRPGSAAGSELTGTEFADILFPFSSIPSVIEEDRERVTVSGSLQWMPTSKTNLVFDGTYSRRNLDYNEKQANVRMTPLPGTNPILTTINVDENGILQGWTGDAPIFLNTDLQTSVDDIFSVGLNLEQDLGNEWTGSFDLSLSNTTTEFVSERAALRVPGSSPDFLIPYDAIISDKFLQVFSTSNFNFSDPNNYEARGFNIENIDITDTEFATRADIVKSLGGNVFSKFKLGARYRTRTRENELSSFLDGLPISPSEGAIALNVGQSDISTLNGDSEFLEGDFTDGFYESVLFIENVDEWRALHEQAGGIFQIVRNPNESFEVQENTLAFYTQLDLDTKIGDLPLTGNFGIRLVNTNITVEGQTQDIGLTPLDPNDPDPNTARVTRFIGDPEPFSNDNDYFSFLPSLNLKIQTGSNTFLRAAYSRTITRPQFVNLGGFNFNPTNNIVNSAGNPSLEPYEASNYDIGMEWYYGGTGAVGISFFHKELSSFVTNVNIPNFEALGNVWDAYNTFENQGEGSITGTEISIQQPLKFLPEPFSGLGIIANFTFADGEQNLNDGSPVPFPGISDFSFNSAIYYDNGGKFQARLAYTYRDDFLIIPQDVFGQEQYNDDYGQLDASVSYKLTDNFTIFGEAINLTDQRNQLYLSNPSSPSFNLERPTSYEMTGVRWSFGIRGVF